MEGDGSQTAGDESGLLLDLRGLSGFDLGQRDKPPHAHISGPLPSLSVVVSLHEYPPPEVTKKE
jgi:hypothetical protein